MSEPNRIFNLHRFFGNAPFQFKTDSSGIQRLSDDDRNLLIDVHGNAMMSNTPAAKAAYGVYFGDGSRHNECGLVPAGVHLGNQAAELYALLVAVKAVKEFSLGADIELVVIRMDSTFVPKHMDELVWAWERNNFTNRLGLPVVNASLFRQLHDAFLALENNGIEVQMWQVPRKENLNAEKLCKSAFVVDAPDFSNGSTQEVDWMDMD